MIFRVRYALKDLHEVRDFATPQALFDDLFREGGIIGPITHWGFTTFIYPMPSGHENVPTTAVDPDTGAEVDIDLHSLILLYDSHHAHLAILSEIRRRLAEAKPN